MKSYIYKIILSSLCIFSWGCYNINSTSLAGNIDIETKAYLDANIEVTDRISGSASRTYILGFIPLTYGKTYSISNIWNDWEPGTLKEGLFGIDPLITEASYMAIKNSNADIIVEPRYEISNENFFLWQHRTCIVTGFKGEISNFKNIPTSENKKIEYLNN
tara:strand:- start:15 stop:497 length:483 start_codon:yes stop_codon:yes gene_type:complete